MKLYFFIITVNLITVAFCGADQSNRKQELNDAMAQRAQLMVEKHQSRERMDKAWSDKNLTSPAIEKLRGRLRELQFEMIRVREELKKEIARLPEMQQLEARVEQMDAAEKKLREKIEQLKK